MTSNRLETVPLTPIAHQWSFAQIANPACELCPLHQSAQVPCLTGVGPREAKVAIFGEGPGLREDEIRRPFSGRAGKLLDKWLLEVGLDRAKLFIDNVTRCFPGDTEPTVEHARACHVYTQQILEALHPDYVICLGGIATQHLMGLGKITANRGRIIQKNGTTYLATLHPAFVLRSPSYEPLVIGDLNRFARLIRGERPLAPDKVQVAETIDRVDEALLEMAMSPAVAFDLETEGLKSWASDKRVWCIGLSNGTSTWSIPLEHPLSPLRDCLGATYGRLKAFLENSGPRLIAQNGQFDLRWLATRGITARLDFDTMLAAHLLDENTSVGLKSLASLMWGVPDYKPEVEQWEWRVPEYQELLYYVGLDAFYTARAYQVQRLELLDDRKLTRFFTKVMVPAAKGISRVEQRGIYLDSHRLEERRQQTKNKLEAIEQELNQVAQRVVNWGSPQQVGQVLFGDLRLPVIENNKTGPSTREQVLVQLKEKHPLPGRLIDLRETYKYESTYFKPWEEFAAYDSRIHFHYNLAGTVTGRLSSRAHQIPRNPFVRSILGAPPGKLLIKADQAQEELRLIASAANETTMIREFKEGKDPHLETAHDMTGLDKERIDFETRKKAKAVNFGFPYGMGWRNFQRYAIEKFQAAFSEEESKQARAKFFAHWPLLTRWHEEVRRIVRKQGYIRYPDGRIRHLPGIHSSDPRSRAEAERQAINSPVQGLGTDLLLMAMLELEGLVPGGRALDLEQCFTVGYVHDELLFEVDEEVAQYWGQVIKEVLEHPKLMDDLGIELRVPLVAEIKIAQYWAEPEPAKELTGVKGRP